MSDLTATEELLNAEQRAREALAEITSTSTIGPLIDRVVEADNVVSFLFECTHQGYPGWRWTVTMASVNGKQPSVLEVELMPGTDALLAPDWIPWTERLAQFKEAQAKRHTELSGPTPSETDKTSPGATGVIDTPAIATVTETENEVVIDTEDETIVVIKETPEDLIEDLVKIGGIDVLKDRDVVDDEDLEGDDPKPNP